MAETYFNQRLSELQLTEQEALQYGIRKDKDGNILLDIFDHDGEPVTYVSKKAENDYNRHKRYSAAVAIEEVITRRLSVLRYTPDNLEAVNEDLRKKAEKEGIEFEPMGKYKFPAKRETRTSLKSSFTPPCFEAYNRAKKGGAVYGIEGQFKAIAMAKNGLETIAFHGIQVYRLCDRLREYLEVRQPDSFTIVYDNDLRKLNEGDTKNTDRIQSFMRSAESFAEQFFNFTEDTGLSTRLIFAHVSETLEEKGVDDLLMTKRGKEKEVLQSLESINGKEEHNEYFSGFRLFRSRFTNQLKEYFGLVSHEQFYSKYADQIKGGTFNFGGATYTMRQSAASDLFNQYNYLHIESQPFTIQHERERFKVKKYLSEIQQQIDDLIEKHHGLCVIGATGIGKTSIFTGFKNGSKSLKSYTERTGRKVIIAVPYNSQARQLSTEKGVVPLHGGGRSDSKAIQEAMNADVVVCTYDLLKRIDVSRRLIVLDESHNIVKGVGGIDEHGFRNGDSFRTKTMMKVHDQLMKAEKVVTISATPSIAYAKLRQDKIIEVKRELNPEIHIEQVETDKRSNESIQESLISELRSLDFTKRHFVYWNNTAQLEAIKDYLTRNSILKETDIALITRPHLDAGLSRVYDEITRHSEIRSAQLVLSTCIISEGINIKNTDIGKVIVVDESDYESVVQLVNRFRNMKRIDVVSIKPKEKDLSRFFLMPTEKRIEFLTQVAELEVRYIQDQIDEHASEFTPEELSMDFHRHPENYGLTYKEIWRWVYIDDDGKARIDKLKMIAAEREREMKGMNNAYFYSKLAEYGFTITRRREAEKDESIAQQIQEVKSLKAEEKKKVRDIVIETLKDSPEVVVNSYLRWAKEAMRRDVVSNIQRRAADLIKEDDETRYQSLEFLKKYSLHFDSGNITKLANAYLKLHSIKFTDETIHEILSNYNHKQFSSDWRRYRTFMLRECYNEQYLRRLIKVEDKAEIKGYNAIAKRLSKFESGFTEEQLRKEIQIPFTKIVLSKSKKKGADLYMELPIASFTKEKALSILKSMFEIERKKYIRHSKYSIVGEIGVDVPCPFRNSDTPPDSKELRHFLSIL